MATLLFIIVVISLSLLLPPPSQVKISATMPPTCCFVLLLIAVPFFLPTANLSTIWTVNASLSTKHVDYSALSRNRAAQYDFPTANLSTLWTNNASLHHNIDFSDRSAIRPILLRGKLGPSFALGFYCQHACDAFLLAIFTVYTDSVSNISINAIPQVVWSANRDRPVRENATLHFSQDGDLLLRDADGTFVWSTNTSARSVVGMSLTDNGNLVLVDGNNAPIWASFDHPTDSLVLGQTLREGQRLTANISATNWTRGQFYLTVESDGLYAFVDASPPQRYVDFSTLGKKTGNKSAYVTFTNGSLQLFDLFTQSGQPDALLSLPQSSSSVQYMRLESDGHLRLYEWQLQRNLLGDVFTDDGLLDNCAYPTVCGNYGICSNGQCSCPGGSYGDQSSFTPVNGRQLNLGCVPVTPLSCQSIQDHHLLALDNVSYFDSNAAAVPGLADEESCKQACLRNCSCKAAVFNYFGNISNGSCYLPSQLFSLMTNQLAINVSTFIKVQIPQTAPSPAFNGSLSFPPSGNSSVGVTLGFVLGSLLGFLLVTGIIFVLLRAKKAREIEEEDQFDQVPGMPTRFSFAELKAATDDFCRKLGEGGFGSVFEGKLGDGTRVAVKRLDGIGHGKSEFLAEVETIGSIHHINLVRLIGFCAQKSHRLLVYEYMCNGSLDKWIFYNKKNNVLDWHMRSKIITDVAKGLSYLHEGCRQRIAHLDIKPHNILLDDKLDAKVSDFGLAKLIDRDKSNVMTRMRGTPGYLAPEWLSSIITEKVDVYSFGVVVMEIVCGRKNLDYSQPEENSHLIKLLQDKSETDQLLDLVDPHINLGLHKKEVIEMMELAMWCLQNDCNRRPSMSTVVRVLEGAMSVETYLDCNFSTPAVLVSHGADNLNTSAPLSASILSGAR